MNAVVLSRQFIRPASFKESGCAIANQPIPELETVFGPIPEEQPGSLSAHYLTGDELAKNQLRLAGFIGTLLRI